MKFVLVVAFISCFIAASAATSAETNSTAAASSAEKPPETAKEEKPKDEKPKEEKPDPYDPISYVCYDNGFHIQTRRNHSEANRRSLGGNWSVTCQDNVLDLDCGKGKLIRLVDAEYGRFDTTTCHNYPMFFMRCEAGDTYYKVHQRCDNKQRCSVNASALEFGDPCPGIIKYLRVKHKCEPAPELKRKIICEKDKETIECPEGKAVMVADAFYGRMDSTTCPHANISNTNCTTKDALDIIGARCDHKPNCTLTASNGEFDDPCVGTYKYIQVDYQCVQDDLKFALACQDANMILECKNMSYINVIRAEYGRGHPFVCNSGSKKIEPEGCSSPNELAIVFGKCQGKKVCEIPASSSVFGEPCIGKPKYLEVDFFCSDIYEESDSGGPPQITSLKSDRVAFISNRLNANNSKHYIAQIKAADEDDWHTVMDAEKENFDFSHPHTIGGLDPDEYFDTRIIKKNGIVSSCLPFTRIRARKE